MSKYESPEYHVLTKEDECELRRYTDFYVVEYENSKDPELNKGFGTLFKYISSDNKMDEKIPMTVPVIQNKSKETKKMAFVVPEKYRDHIPDPNSPNLTVRRFEEGLFAAVCYSGRTREGKELRMMNKLTHWLEGKGYQTNSDFMVAVYNGPFTLPTARRNEVWVRVTEKDSIEDNKNDEGDS